MLPKFERFGWGRGFGHSAEALEFAIKSLASVYDFLKSANICKWILMMKLARANIIMLYTLKVLHFSNWPFDLLQMIGSKTTRVRYLDSILDSESERLELPA